jgi:magnesium transporter
MDSIVDAFFPALKEIEKEVLMVEEFVSRLETNDGDEIRDNPFDQQSSTTKVDSVPSDETAVSPELKMVDEKKEDSISPEPVHKPTPVPTAPTVVHATLSKSWRQLIPPLRFWRRSKKANSNLARDMNRLRRMTTTRRLVTTLARLLSSKSEVIAQIRKRLSGQDEVAIYLGDVQDHIISLNQSLAHYERMLSHSHPAYLSHLRYSMGEAKDGLDRALMLLGLVSLLVLCSQSIAQLGGMNINVPRRDNDYGYFGVFLGVAIILSVASAALARYWYVKAHGGASRIEEI